MVKYTNKQMVLVSEDIMTECEKVNVNKLIEKNIVKLVSAIFYQIFIFSLNNSLSQDNQILVVFLPFHTFKIQKDKLKKNNL